MMRASRTGVVSGVVMALLLASIVGLQAMRERRLNSPAADRATGNLLYVSSPAVVSRAALSYKSVVADVYWIRTVQHFGRARLGEASDRQYDLLYPLLDLTTSLDPRFNVPYRFGSIFLTERPPGGPGRPDLAIRLLEKGLAAQPKRWEYAQDIGFVHYREGDYASAADWFRRAADIPGAPTWLQPLEAVTRTRGGDRETARQLWTELLKGAGEDEWLRNEADRRLKQLEALDLIEALERAARDYEVRTGMLPRTWADLERLGYIRGTPADPAGFPLQLNPYWGEVTVDVKSPMHPLPRGEEPAL